MSEPRYELGAVYWDDDEPTIPAPPKLWRWRLRLAVHRWIVNLIAAVTRPKCARCWDRPVYTWRGDYWPREWLCETCTWLEDDYAC